MAPRKKEKINRIYEELNAIYGPQKCALEHADPLQLLVATILSAQCTDRMVNIVTADLFRKYRSATDFASASQEELEQEIHKCGYYRAKAGNIIGANILDMTLILPVCALISNLKGGALNFTATVAAIDLPACLIVGCIAVFPMLIQKKFSRWQGILLLVVYAGYVVVSSSESIQAMIPWLA